MSSPIVKFIEFKLRIRADNPRLLEGLDAWLNVGVLSDEQVRQICQEYLSEPLPPQPTVLDEISPSATSEESSNLDASVPIRQPQRNRNLSGLPNHLFQSLKAEFSVRWLLFLGLFMVLVSSGVLVASRWQELPTLGQYGVLFAYTLGFGVATIWPGLNSRLPLTSETLKWVTLLLIPLNFWAIDGLGLLYSTPVISAFCILILTLITILINPSLSTREPQRIFLQRSVILNQLGLSYLQLGWKIPHVPLIALYLGIIATGIVTFYRRQDSEQIRLNSRENLPLFFCLVPLVFLWWRVIFVLNLDLSQLGLAFGLTGGLFYLYSSVWFQRCGYLILLAGWLVSLENQPQQALAVSGIALGIFGINLKQFWRKQDLALIFMTGLQTHWLIWRLIPLETQQKILEISLKITQSPVQPWVLLGLVGLIYLVFMLALADWIYQSEHPKLSKVGERLTLNYGAILTFISLFDPVVRTLNLLISTVILIVYTSRQPLRVFLVYLTHLTGLLTLGSFIELFFPQLPLETWGILSILFMLTEWIFYIIFSRQQRLTFPNYILNSAWYLGLGLAGLSYQFFYSHSTYNLDYFCQNLTCKGLSQWGIIWLITPAALTTISRLIPPRRQLAAKLSILAAIMVQLLVFRIPGIRLISWGVATGLMVANTYYLQNTLAAIITVGFGLTFYGFLVWETVPNLTFAGGLVVLAIALNSLWIFQAIFYRLSTSLSRLYVTAIESWTPILWGVQIFGLTGYAVGIYWQLLTPNTLAVLATILSITAVIIRLLNNPQTENSQDSQSSLIYVLGWEVELLMAHTLSFTENSLFNLSIANLILGLMTQILGEYWQRRNRIHHLSNPWQILPLFYGIFGAVLRSSASSFDNWTGISWLILALIFLGIGRRRPQLKPLTYIGVFGVSLSSYQLLFYNLDSVPIADQLIAFAGLGTTIVYVYRLLSTQLIRYLHLTENEIKSIAHLHWAVSSCFLIISQPLPSQSNPWLSLGIGLFLTRYAVFQARYNSNSKEAEFWVYIGCLEAATIAYFISEVLNLEGFLIPWAGAIVSIIAYFLYFLPWESWGWQIQPWRRVAIYIPAFTVVLTTVIGESNLELSWYISTLTAFILYLVLAQFSRKIQLTYFSVGLINFAYYHWLLSTQYDLSALADSFLPGLSLLYFAQVDPFLQHPQQKLPRHWIRILGIGTICFAALLTSEGSGLVAGFISLIAIFIGLGFRIRAFLYVGTATFLVNAINQLLILNSIYSFFKWIVGFIVGLVLIWIAANFETRREQMVTALQNWINELEEWQ
ncbi:hypothetical protein ACL6C3_02180 [Capilliphycus salinus ALCB114379]|uniref:hypothetical protein n=1 Tax=Capilliphycus salinus TaxID=2768948 RepID=UPI0039A62624